MSGREQQCECTNRKCQFGLVKIIEQFGKKYLGVLRRCEYNPAGGLCTLPARAYRRTMFMTASAARRSSIRISNRNASAQARGVQR